MQLPSPTFFYPEHASDDLKMFVVEPQARLLQIQQVLLKAFDPKQKTLCQRMRDNSFHLQELQVTLESARYLLDRLHSGLGLHNILRSESHVYADLFSGDLGECEALRPSVTTKLVHVLIWMMVVAIPNPVADRHDFLCDDQNDNTDQKDNKEMRSLLYELLTLPPAEKWLDSPHLHLKGIHSLRKRREEAAFGNPEPVHPIHPDWLSRHAPLTVLGKQWAYQLGLSADYGQSTRLYNLRALEARIQSYYESSLSSIVLACDTELQLAKGLQLKVVSGAASLFVCFFNLCLAHWDNIMRMLGLSDS